MSKNKIKRKTTGFDILYRVVTVIMAVAMFPLAYFSKLIFIVVMHEDLSSLLSAISGEEDPGGTYLEWAIADIFDPSSSLSLFINEDTSENLQLSMLWESPYLRAVLFAAIFFALALVLALVILGFAIFSNKVKVITGLSAGGLLAMAASWISFTSFFANPITSGETALSEVFDITGIIANIALGFVEVTTIKLEGAFFWVLFLMLGIFVWSVSVMIVNAGDEKEKAEKAMAKARKK